VRGRRYAIAFVDPPKEGVFLQTMTEQRIDLNMLTRIDSEQKATASRVEGLEQNLLALGREVSEIKGAVKTAETPAWIRFVIFPLCVLATVAVVTTLITLLVKVNRIETFVQDNGGLIAGLRLQQNAVDPSIPQHIADVSRVLDAAQASRTRIPLDVVSSTGAKFMEAVEKTPEAWPAARAYLDYRSFLNADFVPSVKPTPTTGKSTYRPSVAFIPNPQYPGWHKAFQTTYAGGYALSDRAARLETLANPQSEGSEFAFIEIEGGLDTIVLDGEYMKHVIIKNADVQYDGGPIRLEDVYFVNCVFHSRFKLTPTSIRLGREILTATSVKFGSDSQPTSGL
jgi:hypothetical protein